MKVAVVFTVLAILCTVDQAVSQTSLDLELLKIQVENAKQTIGTTMFQLDHLRMQTEEDTSTTVTKKWWEQMDAYRNYVNLLLTAMRKEVNNAKANGVDAQHCYDGNLKGINGHSDKAYQDAAKCKRTADDSIKNSLGFINNIKTVGDTLIEQLNNLFLSCHNIDTVQMKSCIISELGKIENNIKSFADDVIQVSNNAASVSNYVVLEASKCINNVYLLASLNCESSKTSNEGCIKKLLQENGIII